MTEQTAFMHGYRYVPGTSRMVMCNQEPNWYMSTNAHLWQWDAAMGRFVATRADLN